MSRSKRKVAAGCIRVKSEKKDKQEWHGRLRTQERDLLLIGNFDCCMPEPRDVSNPWSMAKDGKPGIFPNRRKPDPKAFRK